LFVVFMPFSIVGRETGLNAMASSFYPADALERGLAIGLHVSGSPLRNT